MLNFYDVDSDYIDYLKRAEEEERGFTRVPNVIYGDDRQKFLCGIVLEIGAVSYYVPVSSNKKRLPDSILILIPTDRFNQVKGTLRFNYMIPVPGCAIRVRNIKQEPNPSRRRFLQEQLAYCQSIEEHIHNQARRTYRKWFDNRGSEEFYRNCCHFALLEKKCQAYEQECATRE